LAVFALVAAALGPAATVCVGSRDESLSVRIGLVSDVPDLAVRLSDAIDRIGAVGGSFSVSGDGLLVEAVIPCG
jgi:hypothetical protein